jgi:hypothetical protein
MRAARLIAIVMTVAFLSGGISLLKINNASSSSPTATATVDHGDDVILTEEMSGYWRQVEWRRRMFIGVCALLSSFILISRTIRTRK